MPASQPVVTEVTLRYSDMDALGHLNNAVYATLCEAGRLAYVHEVLEDETPEGLGYVIVKLTIDFRAEAHYPGVARIETDAVRLGGSSVTFSQTIRIGDRLVAMAEGICALFDLRARKAVRFPDALRQRIAARGALRPEG